MPQIPKATSIATELETIGLSPSIAEQVSDAYLRNAHQLHAACEASLRNALQEVSQQHAVSDEIEEMNKTWAAVYGQQMRAWLESAVGKSREAVLSLARDSISKAKSSQSLPVEKKPFNHEYTPLLEKYFEYNAYPSAPDRAVLARKSMMTPRQIEVWFQNHRNRAKKEGKILRKSKEVSLPPEISLKSLQQKMPFFTAPTSERKPLRPLESQSNTRNVASFTSKTSVLNAPLSPPRGFPTVYIRPDLNPLTSGTMSCTFPAPVWYRKPALPSQPPYPNANMEELVLEFSQKLHLRAPVSNSPISKATQPWCTGRVTVPYPAPLPSFICASQYLHCPSSTVSSVRGFRPPSSHISTTRTFIENTGQHKPSCHPRRSPDIQHQSERRLFRRKVVGLPKQTPRNKSTGRSPATPELPDTSPQSSLLNSRTPSFSSNASRRSPLINNRSSSNSPPTPTSSISTLDDNHVSVFGLDCGSTDDVGTSAMLIRSLISLTPTAKHRLTPGLNITSTHLPLLI